MKSKILYIFVLIACWGCKVESELDYPNTPQGNIEALWNMIDTKYCFIDEKCPTWSELLPEYLEKANKIVADDEFALFDLCCELLDTLNDGHVNIFTSFEYYICRKWFEKYPKNYNWDIIKEKYLTDYKSISSMQYDIIHDSIGYISYSSFSDNFSHTNIYYILTYFADCKAIILDVRNNGGGALTNAEKLASIFTDEDVHVGYIQHKTGKNHNDFSELSEMYIKKDVSKNKWKRPVIVLCNRHSYSATNYFINACRYLKNVRTIGGKSGGGGGIPMSYEMPNGWLVRFSSVRMLDVEKKSIEDGIMPDEAVDCVNEGKDDILEKAIEIIEKI